MNAELIVSSIAATLTTIAFLPQAIHIIRYRDTAAISLVMYLTFATGVFFWTIFGVLIGNWPVIVANVVTLGLALIIIALKLRHG